MSDCWCGCHYYCGYLDSASIVIAISVAIAVVLIAQLFYFALYTAKVKKRSNLHNDLSGEVAPLADEMRQ